MRKKLRPTLSDLGEEAVIRRLARILDPPADGSVGIGDDTALLKRPDGRVLWTTDAMVEGTHFLRAWFRPEETGFKALAANISDAAAMGGRARWALISLVAHPKTPVEALERLYRGMRKLSRREGVYILGGNLARGANFSITVTLIGDVPHGQPRFRTGAKPGDRIYVSGQPGLSYLGLKLLSAKVPPPEARATGRHAKMSPSPADLWDPPVDKEPPWRRRLAQSLPLGRAALRRFLLPDPRTQTARDLHHYRPTAMLDVSDGLAADLRHLAEAGEGARLVVDPGRFPTTPSFRRLSEALQEAPVAAMLHGGEDYELMFTLSPRAAGQVGEQGVIGGVRVTEIGLVVEGPSGVFTAGPDGEQELIAPGFRHY